MATKSKTIKPIAVVDIDGTLSIISAERRRIISTAPIDWAAFYDSDFDDEPIPSMVEMVKNMMANYEIFFCTSRRETARVATQMWLLKHFNAEPPMYGLVMRSNSDKRPDYISKIESFIQDTTLEERSRVALVIDDTPLVVSRWRRLGYLCLTVCPGIPARRPQ